MKFPSRRQFISLVSLLLVGCKRRAASQPATTPSPASRPAVGEATLSIDGEPEVFPPVELLVQSDGSSLDVELTTTDATGPAGENSMRFAMTFQGLDNADELDGAAWHYAEPADSEQDSPNRIDLHGRSERLAPVTCVVTLRLDGPRRAVVSLTGAFNLFNPPDAEKAARSVKLTGEFEAVLKRAP